MAVGRNWRKLSLRSCTRGICFQRNCGAVKVEEWKDCRGFSKDLQKPPFRAL